MERTDSGAGAPAAVRAVVFLSHSGVDAEAARELKRHLEENVSRRETGLRVGCTSMAASRSAPAMQHEARVRGALLTLDGARALSWSEDKILRLWNIGGSAMRHVGPVWGALLMPDGSRVLSWSWDHILRLWDIASGKQIGPAMRHDDQVNGALMTKDGDRALSWSSDKTLRLWDLASGKQIGPAMRHDNGVVAALLAKNGARVLSRSSDGTLRVWNIGWPKAHSLIDLGCSLLKTDDLSSFATRYGIAMQDPICCEGVLIPPPDWGRMETPK